MATTTNCDDETTAINEQRFELLNAKSTEFDLDFAFRLQLEEALAASLTLVPSSSEIPEASSSHNDGDDSNLVELHTSELEKLEQEKRDRELSEIEARKLKDDFDRRIHDQKLAMDIFRLSDEYWDDYGDEFERPFGEGSSSSSSDSNMICRLYFKGMVSVETVGSSKETLSGIGVAICDDRDNLIFQLSKLLEGNAINRTITEIKALTEGLEIALALNLKRITIFFSYLPIYRFALNAWKPKQRKVATLMDKVGLLRQKFAFFCPRLVSVNGIKFAFKLARDAIDSQMSKLSASNHLNNLRETCLICLEETDQDRMFSIDGCLHKYCFSCMKQHVEAKLHDGILPKCLHESCGNELNVISCEKFLTPKLIEIMKQQVREASIPVSEKVYCPYPRCSALMSKAEAYDFAEKENVGLSIAGVRKCLKCGRLFCIHCRVLWHYNKTCGMYMKSNAYPLSEDAKLKSLATRNLWRQCVKCKHMIELAQGCYHMTCRCGYEFCYTCGAEWKNKKATCSCPLWNERNILFEESDYDDEDGEDDEDDDDDDSDYYSDSD